MHFITLTVILILLKFGSNCIPTQHLEGQYIVVTKIEQVQDLTTTTSTTTTTLPPLSCLAGWTIFDRGDYSWCMKMYYGATTSEYGTEDCQSLNGAAVPSGFENVEEISTMMAIASSVDGNGAQFIIGARRSPTCYYSPYTYCTALNSFYWTDGYTTGTTFIWLPTQPDNGDGFSLGPQTYAIVYGTGQMDDIFPTLVTNGVVCGMLAERY